MSPIALGKPGDRLDAATSPWVPAARRVDVQRQRVAIVPTGDAAA
jgi:hypothetical protein